MRRPLSGALLGILLGLAIALILQQQGIWPLDRLTVFLLPGLVGLLAMLLTSVGRRGSRGTLAVALIITLPLVVWGALGLGELGENGQLNGGCQVIAASDIDATTVTDTSRSDPFEIDPDGGLTWAATSPSVFDDYPWQIWTEVGGFQITLDSEESENNDDGSQQNGDDVPNVTAYATQRGISIEDIRGVMIVGGDAAGACDGFGFVSLVADPFESLASKIAAAVLALALIGLILLTTTGRPGSGGASTTAAAGPGSTGAGPGVAAGLAAADKDRDRGRESVDDVENAAREPGFAPEDDADPDGNG